jgi:hypothetical protein
MNQKFMKWFARIGAILFSIVYLETIYSQVRPFYLEFGVTANFFMLILTEALIYGLLYVWALIPLWYYGFKKTN